jgi:hypothetical protein
VSARQPAPGRSLNGKDYVDEREAWLQRNAAQARRALARCEVRAELVALLGVDGSAQRRARRLEEARRELERLELRWRAEGWEP